MYKLVNQMQLFIHKFHTKNKFLHKEQILSFFISFSLSIKQSKIHLKSHTFLITLTQKHRKGTNSY